MIHRLFDIVFINYLIFLIGLNFSEKSVADQSEKHSEIVNNVTTPLLMRQYFIHLIELKKFSFSDKKFDDPKNAAEISLQLKSFADAAKAGAHDPILNQINFKFSRQVLESHISETEKVFLSGNKTYARWMLNSTMSVCVSCHSQIPGPNRPFLEFKKLENYFSNFEQAEFLFATREFDQASEIYDKIIRQDMKFNDKMEVEKSLERQVAYYSRIKRNPEAAIKTFASYQKVQNLTATEQRDISYWLKQFKKWDTQKNIDPQKVSENDILDFAKKNLDPTLPTASKEYYGPELVTYLRVSGVLYEYLQLHPHVKIMPQILYWLAISDRMINHNFFYSLADMYLRECITQYSTEPIAKKCYQEYEKEMIFSYLGSSGVNLPVDVSEDLKKLKNMIKVKVKIKNKN